MSEHIKLTSHHGGGEVYIPVTTIDKASLVEHALGHTKIILRNNPYVISVNETPSTIMQLVKSVRDSGQLSLDLGDEPGDV